MTVGIVAAAIIFWPAAPLFLLMHGKDITFPKGTDVPTFINGDMKLDPAKFQQAQGGSTQPAVAGAASNLLLIWLFQATTSSRGACSGRNATSSALLNHPDKQQQPSH